MQANEDVGNCFTKVSPSLEVMEESGNLSFWCHFSSRGKNITFFPASFQM